MKESYLKKLVSWPSTTVYTIMKATVLGKHSQTDDCTRVKGSKCKVMLTGSRMQWTQEYSSWSPTLLVKLTQSLIDKDQGDCQLGNVRQYWSMIWWIWVPDVWLVNSHSCVIYRDDNNNFYYLLVHVFLQFYNRWNVNTKKRKGTISAKGGAHVKLMPKICQNLKWL